MTITKLFEFVRSVRPGMAFTDAQMLVWLNECEARVQTDIMLIDPADVIEYDGTIDSETGKMRDADTILLVPFPWDKIYRYFMYMMIDIANGEAQRQANDEALYNEAYQEYAGWYASHIAPATGQAELRGYYISAYAYAVRGGYSGTLQDFYETLGDIGSISAQTEGWAEQAQEAAEAAQDSADDAANSATAAANSSVSADDFAQSAGSYAGAAQQSADASAADALKAEGHAIGTQNGSAVEETSRYYHNNAKFYSEQARAVADSIPDDYTDLSDDVDRLKGTVYADSEIDLSRLAQNTEFEDEGSLIIGVVNSSGKWTVSSVATNYQTIQIRLESTWSSVTATANATKATYISFITSRITENPANTASVPLADSGRHGIPAGTSDSFGIPSGATYMLVTYRSTGNDQSPVYIAGVDTNTVEGRLDSAEKDIDALEKKAKYIDIVEVKQPIMLRSYIENGGDIGTVVTITPVYNANFRHAIIHVTAGDEFIIHGRGVSGGSAVAWALTDESYILLDKSDASTANADYTVKASSAGYLITNGDTTHYVKKMESLVEVIDVNSIRPEVIYVDCHETDWNNTEYTSRDGLLESTPLATITAGLALNPRVLVVMDGEYNEALSMTKMTGITICMNQRIRYSAPSGADNRTAYPKGDIVISMFNLTSCNDITLENIHISGSTGNYGMYAERCDNLILTRCICEGNTKPAAPGFRFDLTNVKLYGCIAHDNGSTNGADGFNFHGGSGRTGGHSEMYNCVAYNNGDDGISHHEYCTGYISGGEFYNNQKGGIASPVGGAFIDIENVRCFNNGYGIYAYGNANYVHPGEYDPDGDGVTEYTGMRARISNSVLTPNNNKDITISSGKIVIWNCLYDPNSVSGSTSLDDLTPAYTALVNQ